MYIEFQAGRGCFKPRAPQREMVWVAGSCALNKVPRGGFRVAHLERGSTSGSSAQNTICLSHACRQLREGHEPAVGNTAWGGRTVHDETWIGSSMGQLNETALDSVSHADTLGRARLMQPESISNQQPSIYTRRRRRDGALGVH